MNTIRLLRLLPALAFLIASCCGELCGEDESAIEVPATYPLDYPVADQFCPPIRSTFYEVTRDMVVVRGKRVRQKPNGGYGLPVIDKVGDQNLLHVGADLGWQQVGEPVFAVANGVVRLSSGPPPTKDRNRRLENTVKRQPPNDLAWGNVVVIEHQLALEHQPAGVQRYFTTIYGHLDTRRFVKIGELVKAGQPIGTIGRQHVRINGGYPPHLHFGVRTGRLIEDGTPLMHLAFNGRDGKIVVSKLGEREVEVSIAGAIPPEIAAGLKLHLTGTQFQVRSDNGKLLISSQALWHCPSLSRDVVGYDLSVRLWNDPIAFLRQHGADTRPAPFLPPK